MVHEKIYETKVERVLKRNYSQMQRPGSKFSDYEAKRRMLSAVTVRANHADSEAMYKMVLELAQNAYTEGLTRGRAQAKAEADQQFAKGYTQSILDGLSGNKILRD